MTTYIWYLIFLKDIRHMILISIFTIHLKVNDLFTIIEELSTVILQ